MSLGPTDRAGGYGERVGIRGGLTAVIGTAAVVLGVAACGSNGAKGGSAPPSTVTVTATASSSPPPSTSTPSSASPSPTAAQAKKLPGTCDSLLPRVDVEGAVGGQLTGRQSFVVGVPEKNIGRLAYINCRYGMAKAANSQPKVEIGVSLYGSAAQAQKRLDGTVADYLDHGAAQRKVTVSGLDATILAGSQAGYTVPLLVLASGQRTVAVSVIPTIATAANRETVMAKVVELALQRTAG